MATDGCSPDNFRNLFKKAGSIEGRAVSTHRSVADLVPVPAHACAAALRAAKACRWSWPPPRLSRSSQKQQYGPRCH